MKHTLNMVPSRAVREAHPPGYISSIHACYQAAQNLELTPCESWIVQSKIISPPIVRRAGSFTSRVRAICAGSTVPGRSLSRLSCDQSCHSHQQTRYQIVSLPLAGRVTQEKGQSPAE